MNDRSNAATSASLRPNGSVKARCSPRCRSSAPYRRGAPEGRKPTWCRCDTWQPCSVSAIRTPCALVHLIVALLLDPAAVLLLAVATRR